MACGVAFLALISASCGGPSAPAVPAQAVLAVATYDHGAHFIGEEVKGELTITNVGQAPFKVEAVSASCSCTTTVPTKSPVAPGESIAVGYSITGHAPSSRTIFLKPRTKPLTKDRLVYEAKIVWLGRIDADPSDVSTQVTFGEPIEKRIPLRRAHGIEKLRVTGVKVLPNNLFAARLEPSADPKALPSIVVSTERALQPARYSVRLGVDYEDDAPGVQSIPFELTVLSKVVAEPSPALIDFEKGAKNEVPLDVTLRSRTNEPFTVEGITCENCTLA
ncbi:MAG: DUF1573 domain-containing protein, partial [Candidatus Hydrogenedentales bacterium]